ncbi:hypothetical protein T440DRAFT_306084 [Plenodomus tracheiphilus IPT5]|uniref:Uncharacterized protein n=1 Tax=Plenodomus tracheiphilus IPT5 TaxID=1408161 RepID=A0A6A7BDW8_9PLEO|nr:hypothetical protein T440DRAFT_306084 [Plenodomus tracheiphilus IPT5]
MEECVRKECSAGGAPRDPRGGGGNCLIPKRPDRRAGCCRCTRVLYAVCEYDETDSVNHSLRRSTRPKSRGGRGVDWTGDCHTRTQK